MMEGLFWCSVAAVLYPYLGYPALLWAIDLVRRRRASHPAASECLSVSVVIPVHNEERRIARKGANTAALDYPPDRIQVLFVSDGSTDGTVDLIQRHATGAMTLVVLPERGGKAAALNAGLQRATGEILVFTDASIQLAPDALRRIVGPFSDPAVGCVSGEDRVGDGGGEGLYGRYELLIRRLESRVGSIVGASGSFYAQRRTLCRPFIAGMAPDFLSVLRTVAQGARAVSEPSAVGTMTSVKDPRQEYARKVRTLIRGMTTLFGHAELLNPVRYGTFAVALFSHKVMRWLAPIFLLSALGSSLALSRSPFYLAASAAQIALVLLAVAAARGLAGIERSAAGRIAIYFVSVNMAVVAAWFHYLRGMRQELWTPSNRS
jgi:hypothetical protein